MRWANSDPITGQAAWFDLRINIEKVANPEATSKPDTGRAKSPVGTGPDTVAHGDDL